MSEAILQPQLILKGEHHFGTDAVYFCLSLQLAPYAPIRVVKIPGKLLTPNGPWVCPTSDLVAALRVLADKYDEAPTPKDNPQS